MLFFLEEGTVQVVRSGEGGRTAWVGLYRPGDVVAEGAFLGERPVEVTATCLEPCVTRELAEAVLARLAQERPALGIAVIRSLTAQIRWLSERVGTLSEPTLEERTYAVLANVACKMGRVHPRGWLIEVPLSHEEIGRLVGAHRVSVTRAMAGLRRAGRVQREARGILVVAIYGRTATADLK